MLKIIVMTAILFSFTSCIKKGLILKCHPTIFNTTVKGDDVAFGGGVTIEKEKK